MTTDNSNVMTDYVNGLKERFPDIKPYDMDDWDWTWADDGYQFLEACDFGMAELTFQRLVAARPNDPDGYEGLAMVYQAIGIRSQACMFIEEALRLANQHVTEGKIDPDVMDEMHEAHERILAMPETAPEQPGQEEGDENAFP